LMLRNVNDRFISQKLFNMMIMIIILNQSEESTENCI